MTTCDNDIDLLHKLDVIHGIPNDMASSNLFCNPLPNDMGAKNTLPLQ